MPDCKTDVGKFRYHIGGLRGCPPARPGFRNTKSVSGKKSMHIEGLWSVRPGEIMGEVFPCKTRQYSSVIPV